jgi:hypothetical protein
MAMDTRRIAALFGTERMMGRRSRPKQWTGLPKSPRPNKLSPIPRMLQIALQRARDTHAGSVSQSPRVSDDRQRRDLQDHTRRQDGDGPWSWVSSVIRGGEIKASTRADEAARLMKPDKGSGDSATPQHQVGRAVLAGLRGYGVDRGCRTRAPITCPRRISRLLLFILGQFSSWTLYNIVFYHRTLLNLAFAVGHLLSVHFCQWTLQ